MGPIWAALGPQSLVNNKVNNDKINVNPSLPFLMDGENSFQFAKKDLFDEAIHSNLSDRNTDYSILNNDAHSNHNNSQHRGDNTQSANPNSESNFGQYNETSNSNFNTTYTTSSNSNFTEPTNSHTGSFFNFETFTPSFSSNRIQSNHLYPAPRNSSGEIEWCMIEDSHKIGRYNITRNEWKNYFIFIQDKFEEDIFFRTKVRVNFIKDNLPFEFLDLMITICYSL